MACNGRTRPLSRLKRAHTDLPTQKSEGKSESFPNPRFASPEAIWRWLTPEAIKKFVRSCVLLFLFAIICPVLLSRLCTLYITVRVVWNSWLNKIQRGTVTVLNDNVVVLQRTHVNCSFLYSILFVPSNINYNPFWPAVAILGWMQLARTFFFHFVCLHVHLVILAPVSCGGSFHLPIWETEFFI